MTIFEERNLIMRVVFVVTELADIRKFNSSLELEKEYIGTFREENNTVWWTDPKNDEEWVFWVDDTCTIIKHLEK